VTRTPGILLNLAWICGRLERHTDAIEYTRRALELYRPGLGGFGEIVALVNLSFSYARVHRHAEAVITSHQALALAKQLAYPDAEVEALNTLAEAYRLAGDHPAAPTTQPRTAMSALGSTCKRPVRSWCARTPPKTPTSGGTNRHELVAGVRTDWHQTDSANTA